MDSGGGKSTYKVWDAPTRLFHWTLVALMVFSFFTGRAAGDWLKWHFWSGYAIIALVLFRIVWGFVGSATARFSDFVRGPAAVLRHLRELLGPGRPHDVGHNPVGGWMVLALLAAVLVQAGAGLFTTDDIATDGPLVGLASSEWVARATTLHKLWINLILVMVGLHVAAALVYLVVKKQNLIMAMITGRKPVPPGGAPNLRFVSPLRAAIVLALAAAVVFGIVRLGG